MMKLNIAICDDNKLVLDNEKTLIEETLKEMGIPYKMDKYQNPENLIKNAWQYDLVFLDVEMDEVNGIVAAESIHNVNKECLLFFVTNHEVYMDYAMNEYAFRFWVKPMSKEKLKYVFVKNRVVIMKIKDIINNKKVTVSFEVFPPKQWDKIANTKKVVDEMVKDKPAFMSVTYGAAGTTSGFTTEIANAIKQGGVEPLSHLTCLTSTKEKINSVLDELEANGIENVLALRGDIPKDFEMGENQYYHNAFELVSEIKARNKFCIGAACYPETHPESKNRVEDIARLKEKVDCGVDFITTQMFFDNEKFYNFREMCAIKEINVPIIAGIMPITNANQIKRSVELSNASLPVKFSKIMERFGENPDAMKQAGIVYATEQIIDLMANGVNNIHIYTMNKPDVAHQIMEGLSAIINE